MTSKFYFVFVLILGALWTCVKLMEILFLLFESKRKITTLSEKSNIAYYNNRTNGLEWARIWNYMFSAVLFITYFIVCLTYDSALSDWPFNNRFIGFFGGLISISLVSGFSWLIYFSWIESDKRFVLGRKLVRKKQSEQDEIKNKEEEFANEEFENIVIPFLKESQDKISKLKAKKTKIRTKIALLDESVSSDILSQIEFNEKLDNLNKSLQLIEVELLANEQKSARIRGNSKKIIGLNKLYSEDLISRDECENKINQLITGQAIDAD